MRRQKKTDQTEEMKMDQFISLTLQQTDGLRTMHLNLRLDDPNIMEIIRKAQETLDNMPKERQPIQWSPEARAALERVGLL